MNDLLDAILELLRQGVSIHVDIQLRSENQESLHTVTCKDCGREFKKSTLEAAKRALRAHQYHCSAYAEQMQWVKDINDRESQGQ